MDRNLAPAHLSFLGGNTRYVLSLSTSERLVDTSECKMECLGTYLPVPAAVPEKY